MLKKLMVIALAAAAPVLMAVPSMAGDITGDAAAGEKVFRKCKACHAVGEKAKNRVGPLLNGVVGRAAGGVEGYKYSKAMTESGLTWDHDTLYKYLEDPKGFVKGTKMIFRGLKKKEDRENVIAYLATFNAEGKAAEAAAAQ